MDDDIYFKNSNNGDNNDPDRFGKDKFRDADYYDEDFELKFRKKGNAQMFESREDENKFRVDIPSDKINNVGNFPNNNISRTPKGRPINDDSKLNAFSGNDFISSSSHREPIPQRTQPFSGTNIQNDAFSNGGAKPDRTPKGQPEKLKGMPSYEDYQFTQISSQNQPPLPTKKQTPSRTPNIAGRKGLNNTDEVFANSKKQKDVKSKKAKKKGGKGKKIAIAVFALLIVCFCGLFAYGYSVLGKINYDNDIIDENQYIDESKLASSSDVKNILFIGSDARSDVDGQRSDTMMLFSIDKKHNKIKLTSFLRDSYVYIPAEGYSTKLNAAFRYGGAQEVIDTLEYNYEVKIDSYVQVDFVAFQQLVDLLGGITVEDVTKSEAKYMNEDVDIKSVKEGTNQMNGKVALWYCRIRYLDDDFNRTKRQRKVISAIIAKAKKTNVIKLMGICEEIVPNISSSIQRNDLITLAFGAAASYIRYDIVQQQIPAPGTWSNATINGQDVLQMDMDENAKILKDFIYSDKTTEE